MDSETKRRLVVIHSDLVEITNGCRDDMHEPDEQDLKAVVVGFKLDNACGTYLSVDAIENGWQEYVVCLELFDQKRGFTKRRFNLADLIALARLAKV